MFAVDRNQGSACKTILRLLIASLLTSWLIMSRPVLAASAEIDYLLHCSGCHRPGGEGHPPNVPTLHDELGHMMTVPEVRAYLVQVPGSAHAPLSDSDLADVINWVLQEFNADTLPEEFRPLSPGEVARARQTILADPLKYRSRFWKGYGSEQSSGPE